MSESATDEALVRFGAFELDLKSGELRKAGLLLNLPPQPFKILALLATHPGQLVTREEIQRRIWGSETFVDFEQGLNFAINKIRTTLGDEAGTPRYIETLPRRGYRFVSPVEAIGAQRGLAGRQPIKAGDPLQPSLREGSQEAALQSAIDPTERALGSAASEETVHEPQSATVNPGMLRWRTGLTLMAMLIVCIAVGLFVWHETRFQAPQTGRLQIHSLAVLPLENLSGDSSQEFFADGMTDELITDLASISSLRVISRTSTVHYKGTRKTIPEIARELNVDAVVEGSVGRSANKVRIRAQLVRAAPEEHLWAESYERDLPDVLTLQRDVAKAIADEIKVKLTPEEKARLANARQVNPEAYYLYLRGRFSFESWTPDAVARARTNFQEAIAKDPSYALAYAGLADTYVFGEADLDPKVAIPLARAAATKALQLDDTLSDAHAALAQVKFLGDWDWAGADKEFRRAIVLNPGDTLAHHMYSHFLLNTGRNEASLKESELYLRLDPLSVAAHNHLGYHYLVTGQYDLAIEQEHKALQVDPSYHQAIYFLGEAYRRRGMPQEALVQYEKAMTLSGTDPGWVRSLRKAYQAEGWRGYFRKSLDLDLERSNREYVSPCDIAKDYALLGDKAQAFRYLDKGYADRDAWLVWIKAERDFDALHSDPRYADLLRRMGLPP